MFEILSGDSGVQYRSTEFKRWRVKGYQAQIDADGLSHNGYLFDEHGRKRLANIGESVMFDKNGRKHVLSTFTDSETAQNVHDSGRF